MTIQLQYNKQAILFPHIHLDYAVSIADTHTCTVHAVHTHTHTAVKHDCAALGLPHGNIWFGFESDGAVCYK